MMKNLNLDSSTHSGDEGSSGDDTLTCSNVGSPGSAASASKTGANGSETTPNNSAKTKNSSCSNSRVVDPEPEKPPKAQQSSSVNSKPDIPKVSMDDFKILKVLGKGAYGKVFQVRKVRGPGGGGTVYAMKAMDKSRICGSRTDVRHTKAERDVLVSVEHPFIVKLKFAFETPKRLYLVQEFCCGGELFRRMEVERLMVESVAKFYLQEIVLALEYLHSLDIVYRDLKTENVMLDREGHVKLIDFGLSKTHMKGDSLTHTFCGTVEYMAPEVILKEPGYGKPADWWSFGVFTFDLLTGRSPFHSNQGKAATKERILKGKFATPRVITPDANDFVRKLLRRPVERRLGSKGGAEELKSHPFFSGTDWDAVLRREERPPFQPDITSETDVQNFDTMFTSRTPRESKSAPLSTETQNQLDSLHFEDFDFVASEFLEPVPRNESESETNPSSVPVDDRRSSCGGATTSGVSSGASSVSHSVSAESLTDSTEGTSGKDDITKDDTTTLTEDPSETLQDGAAAENNSPEINELRICSHGS